MHRRSLHIRIRKNIVQRALAAACLPYRRENESVEMADEADVRTARLKVLLGTSGANKVWHLPASSPSEECPAEAKTQQQGLRARGVVMFFVGDQLEGGVSQEVLKAQVRGGACSLCPL